MEYGRKVLKEFQHAKKSIGRNEPILLQLKFGEKFLFESYFEDAEILSKISGLPCFLESGVMTLSFSETYYDEFVTKVIQQGYNILVIYIDIIET